MNTSKKTSLKRIISDKTSGSSEILIKLNRFLLSNRLNQQLLKESSAIAQKELSHFSAIKNYLRTFDRLLNANRKNDLFNYLASFENKESKKFEKIFKTIYKKLPRANTILTISKSGTLLEVFKLWFDKNKKLKIIVPESRPASEGKLMAKELLKFGISVELITDSMTGIFIKKADAVIIGADIILKNGNVINKSGSLNLALLCKYYKKPFYVLAGKSKFQSNARIAIKEESSDSLWDFNHIKLKITNIPFEQIDKKFITSVITG